MPQHVALSATADTLLSPSVIDAERDALVQQNLGLVHHFARQLARRLTRPVDYDELVSAGTLGLLHAVDAFDPARGLAFSTFAAPRVRGAILDELARLDHTPRRIRRTARELAAAEASLTAEHGRAPTDAEVAERLGVARPTLRRWQLEVAGIDKQSLDAPRTATARGGEAAGGAARALELPAPDSAAPDARLDGAERTRVLSEAILALKEQQRAVLGLYYFAGLNVPQIAQVFGVSQSRVCQIHKQALSTVRERCAAPLGYAA
jgi:RNA polymerase sigma factor for flagellar operon FliA